jgi:dUTP pyrophosphatase
MENMQNMANMENNLLATAFNKHPNLMVLKIFIDVKDNLLLQRYQEAVNVHNNKVLVDPFPDAGFDIFVTNDILTLPGKLNRIDFGLKCSARIFYEYGQTSANTGFYMYPRSSLSGTNLRLANSVGIIDSGYRGHLIGAFDCQAANDTSYLYNPSLGDSNLTQYCVKKYNRLTQICAPGLVPIFVILVDSEAELGNETSRGSGGFGSTSNY